MYDEPKGGTYFLVVKKNANIGIAGQDKIWKLQGVRRQQDKSNYKSLQIAMFPEYMLMMYNIQSAITSGLNEKGYISYFNHNSFFTR